MSTSHLKCSRKRLTVCVCIFSREKHVIKPRTSQWMCLDYNRQASNYPCRPTQLQYWFLSQKHKRLHTLGIIIFK